jgi:hypothetical protein
MKNASIYALTSSIKEAASINSGVGGRFGGVAVVEAVAVVKKLGMKDVMLL